MNKYAFFAALAVSPLSLNSVAAETPAAAGKIAPVSMESVGVVPAKVVPAVDAKVKQSGRTLELQAFTQALENRLTEALTSTRKFKVVTRGDLDAVLAEQNLASSGNLNADDPQLAQRFKLAGVKSILLVTVDDFQDREESFRSEAAGETFRRRTIRVAAAAKLIDTTTGQVRESVSIPAVTQDDVRGVLARLRTTADRADAIAPELARLVSARIAQRLVDARFPAKVLAKSPDGVVTFNRGDGSGVQAGQEWGVYAVGEALVDPDTGESLGAEEVLIGRAVVTEIDAKFSKAKLLKDNGVERGAVLRPVAAGSEPVKTIEAPVAKPVEAPAPVVKTEAPAEAPVIRLVMDRQGDLNVLSLDGNTIAPADAKDTFARLALAKPGAKVVLSASDKVTGDSVQKVMKALGDAGFDKIEFEKK